ncbi:IucA/IucC family C-terminal-domain containing protein [Paenibacillus eucommiae]|uniref:Ferric iron reductase protein FhuF n=1 Tax=Paenibacillus eucommiae TaxID=1355755 RepID=A0ABS4J2Y9_9BACL|nr:IucA/IucC family C-terminal-domain containing protein [Paenibacillus eucommiae]MBP1994207.1 ferric iron reductase protein FhuF [Paenibacillus eucommiae]
MPASLTQMEWESLSTSFSLSLYDNSRPFIQSLSPVDLLEREKCERYLDWLMAYIGAPSRRVTASMLAKRYAFLTVAPVLYAMTMYDKGLRLSSGNCRLVSPDYSGCDQEKSRFPDLTLNGLQVTEPAAGKRQEWRDHVLHDIFAGHLSPIFRSLSEVGRVPMAILWENTAVRIVPLYEDGLEESDGTAIGLVKQRICDDFDYIAHKAPASLFGEPRNPLSRFMGSTVMGSPVEEATGIRQTCCLFYEIAAEYCRKCPIPSRFMT